MRRESELEIYKMIKSKQEKITRHLKSLISKEKFTTLKSRILSDDGEPLFKTTHDKSGISCFGITPKDSLNSCKKVLLEEALSDPQVLKK